MHDDYHKYHETVAILRMAGSNFSLGFHSG